MVDVSPNTLLTFRKAQSAFLGLESPASQGELLMLEALYKRSRPGNKKNRNSNRLKRISRNAWKMIEDERLSPSAAKVKYDRMVCLLKEKYKLRKNESQVTEVACSDTTTQTRTDGKSQNFMTDRPELDFPDAFTHQKRAEDKLEDLTATSQSSSASAAGIESISSDMSMPLIKIAQLPDDPPLNPPLLSTFRVRTSTSKQHPGSDEPRGTYRDGIFFHCEVCDARLVDAVCPNGHEPRECPDCGWEIVDGASKCRDCQSKHPRLTKEEKIQKLLVKVAEDREKFGLCGNSSDANDDDSGEDNPADYDSIDGVAMAEDDDSDIEMSNVAFFDTGDSVWRCAICSWEIEADDEISGHCASGHIINLDLVPDYIPADSDSDGEEPMLMEWDNDDILEDSDGEAVLPGQHEDDDSIVGTTFELKKVERMNGLYAKVDESGEEIYEYLDEIEEDDDGADEKDITISNEEIDSEDATDGE